MCRVHWSVQQHPHRLLHYPFPLQRGLGLRHEQRARQCLQGWRVLRRLRAIGTLLRDAWVRVLDWYGIRTTRRRELLRLQLHPGSDRVHLWFGLQHRDGWLRRDTLHVQRVSVRPGLRTNRPRG
jgi:hypothetical protein